jgi:hypothetical protein
MWLPLKNTAKSRKRKKTAAISSYELTAVETADLSD